MIIQLKKILAIVLLTFIVPISLIFINVYSAYDLKFYYRLIVERSTPHKIVVIALNEENIPASESIKSIHSWPRNLHAKLIAQLNQAGAASIVFDIYFGKETPDDVLFSQAVKDSNKTFLVNKIELQWLGTAAQYQRIVPPLDVLHNSVVLAAPSVYAADSLGLYYQYEPILNLLDQQLPQLPILLVYWELIQDGSMAKFLKTLSLPNLKPADSLTNNFLLLSKEGKSQPKLFKQAIALTGGLSATQRKKLQGLVGVITEDRQLSLNFLGKPSQIITLGYAEVLAGKHRALLDQATVFVGLSSIFKQTQVDSFLTPANFTGQGYHGVFLLATAYENIAHDNIIKQLNDWQLYFWLTSSFILLLPVFWIRHYFQQGIYSLLVLGLYVAIFLHVLARMHIWLPLFFPVIILVLLSLSALMINVRRNHNVRRRLSSILSGYLPQPAIDKLLLSHTNTLMENSWAVCLITDARGFTRQAEQQTPEKVHYYLNEYYKVLIESITAHGGIVSDLIGDMMLALWVDKKSNPQLKHQAVAAAFEIVDRVQKYNHKQLAFPLHTGIGIHSGELSIGTLGNETHFEYRPIGDMINTTSRIEALNKMFNLPLLVSSDFIDDVKDVNWQRRFIAKTMIEGKQVPVKLYSLTKGGAELADKYSQALGCLEECDFAKAEILFADCVDAYADKASNFYLWLLKKKYIKDRFDGLIPANWLQEFERELGTAIIQTNPLFRKNPSLMPLSSALSPNNKRSR